MVAKGEVSLSHANPRLLSYFQKRSVVLATLVEEYVKKNHSRFSIAVLLTTPPKKCSRLVTADQGDQG